MSDWRIQRENLASIPPRFEWLRRRPTFIPAGTPAPAGVFGVAEGSVSTEDRVGDVRWTWIDPTFVASLPGEVSGWANGRMPHDFGRRKALGWARMIEGVHPVRHEGAPEPEEAPDAAAEESERKRAAREAYREALAAGTAEDLS